MIDVVQTRLVAGRMTERSTGRPVSGATLSVTDVGTATSYPAPKYRLEPHPGGLFAFENPAVLHEI